MERSPRWWRVLAWPLSVFYRLGVAARNLTFDFGVRTPRKLPGMTISVGNIAVGGTGKSPVVLALAAWLIRAGQSPAILTRGYGGGLSVDDEMALLGGKLVMPARSAVRWPDEARMQTVALPSVPVVIGADRFVAADRFLREHPNLKPTHWLLDDGGQHRQLTRDVNIFLVDAAQPFGSGAGAILPAGSLREPKSALKRADLVIATRCDEKHPSAADLAALERLVGRPPLKAFFREGLPERSVDGREAFNLARHSPAFLVTGIAGGERLAKGLEARLGLVLAGSYARPDHQNLVKAELLARLGAARAVLTTAKDYWRDPAVFDDLPVPAFILPLAVEWSEEGLAKALSPWL